MSRAILWPRHEVLQLVLPVFSSCGTVLSNKVIIEVAKRLMQVENSASVVSFDQFVLVSNDILKWNDATSQLFWDMLHAAVWYKVQNNPNNINTAELKTNHIVLFLSLHIADSISAKSPSPNTSPHQFDTVWPGMPELGGDGTCTANEGNNSPTSSPTSTQRKSVFASMSPKSPRNAGSKGMSPRSSPSSPRKSLHFGIRPTAAQYLNTIRMRLPLLLRALALRADPTALVDVSDAAPSTPRDSLEEDLFLHQGDIDCLGLLIGGGHTRDEEVSLLSTLHPHAPSGGDGGGGGETAHSLHFLCNETLEWFVANLCVNESVYPSSPMPVPVPVLPSSPSNPVTANGAPDAAGGSATNILIASKVITHSGPVRIICPMQYLNTSRPTVISGASSVIVHAMAVNCSRSRSRSMTCSSFQECLTAAVRSASGLSLDEASTTANGSASINHSGSKEMFSPGTTSSWYDGGMDASINMSGGSMERAEDSSSSSPLQSVQSNVLSRVEYEKISEFIDDFKTKTTTETLPHLNMQNCSHTSVYLLSPYATGSVTNCTDCELITGPIAGTITIADCERVRLTTIARKVILKNCFDCVINCHTMSPVIISGDSRGLLIGPYNTSYKDLHVHVELASLAALLKPQFRRIAEVRESRSSSSASASSTTSGPPSRAFLNRSVSECNDDDEPDDFEIDTTDHDRGQMKDMWSILWDASLCTDPQHQHQHPHTGHGAFGGSNDNIASQIQLPSLYGTSNIIMATPSEHSAALLPAEKFRFVAIPEQSQYQTFDHCPLDIPSVYLRHITHAKAAGAALAMRVSNELNIPPPPPPPTQDNNVSPPRQGTADAKSASGGRTTVADNDCMPPTAEIEGTNLLSGKFMEWLLTTGKASQIIELIRLDEQLVIQQQQQQQQNGSHSAPLSTQSSLGSDNK